jgi:transcriptional regulator with XRE-family HTH domain
LGQLSDIDHAYIYRLEIGDKESPSPELLAKLTKALKAGKREADMLKYLVEHPETDAGLVEHVFVDKTVSLEVFAAAAGAAFRGAGRPDYPTLISRVRRILDDEGHG